MCPVRWGLLIPTDAKVIMEMRKRQRQLRVKSLGDVGVGSQKERVGQKVDGDSHLGMVALGVGRV